MAIQHIALQRGAFPSKAQLGIKQQLRWEVLFSAMCLPMGLIHTGLKSTGAGGRVSTDFSGSAQSWHGEWCTADLDQERDAALQNSMDRGGGKGSKPRWEMQQVGLQL